MKLFFLLLLLLLSLLLIQKSNSQARCIAISYYSFPSSNKPSANLTTVDSRYLEVEGTLWKYFEISVLHISDVQNWGKYQSNNQISQMNM